MKISSSPCKQSYRNVILETEKASLWRRENFWSTDESSASHEISRLTLLTGFVYHRPQFVTTFSVLPGQIFSEPQMIVLQVGGCFGCFPYSISVDSGGELHDDASGSGATLSLGSESVSMTSGNLWFCSGRTDWHISITFPLTSSFSASLTPCSLRFHLLEYLSNSDILCWQLSTRPSSLVTFFFQVANFPLHIFHFRAHKINRLFETLNLERILFHHVRVFSHHALNVIRPGVN